MNADVDDDAGDVLELLLEMSKTGARITEAAVEDEPLAERPPALDIHRVGEQRAHFAGMVGRVLELGVVAGNQFVRDDHAVEAPIEVPIEGFRLIGRSASARHGEEEDRARVGRPGSGGVDAPHALAGEVGGGNVDLEGQGILQRHHPIPPHEALDVDGVSLPSRDVGIEVGIAIVANGREDPSDHVGIPRRRRAVVSGHFREDRSRVRCDLPPLRHEGAFGTDENRGRRLRETGAHAEDLGIARAELGAAGRSLRDGLEGHREILERERCELRFAPHRLALLLGKGLGKSFGIEAGER